MQNGVLFFFEQGQFSKAEERLNQILLEEDSTFARSGLKVCAFWKKRMEQLDTWREEDSRGDYLYHEWFRFQELYHEEMLAHFEQGYQAVKRWTFKGVIQFYHHKLNSFRDSDYQSYLKVGRSYKFLGSYEEALPLLERALKYNRSSAEIMAELADCYGLMNEMEVSKALFREAFYLDPQKVQLPLVESRYICRLTDQLRNETDYSGEELLEWLPVFAVVYGVFDVKREMRQVEVGQLKQSIYSLKSELKEAGREWKTIPRLLYRYFWLIDYYQSRGTPQEKIQQILMDIQLLDPQIYRLYMS